MTKDEIIEGNKLIAEFMGYEYIPYVKGQTQSPGWWHKNSPNIIKGKMPSATKLSFQYFLCRRHPELRYWNEWNWLMPVVEKIEDINIFGINNVKFMFKWHKTQVSIMCDNGFLFDNTMTAIKGDNRLEATYNGVIKFIKWYNENK